MRSDREPKSAPPANQKSNRGVRYLHRPDRPNPYGVQWPEKEWEPSSNQMVRRVKTLFFPTEEARETKASELRKDRRNRMMVVSASRTDLEDFHAFKKAIGDTPWQDVVAAWRSRLVESGRTPCTLTVADATAVYVKQAKKLVEAEKLSGDYFRHLKSKVEMFSETFGDMTLDRVRTADIVEWIEDMDEVVSDFTFDNYKKHVRAFFSYFIDQEKPVIRDNPAGRIKNRSDGIGEVKIISVEQTAQLFWTAWNYRSADRSYRFRPYIGRLAVECFAGLRFASACRLEKGDISFEDRGILLPAKKLKTKRRHYIDGLPDNLWSWLAITPESCWSLTPRECMRLKSDLFAAARVVNPGNCCRHNFATYHVAAFKRPGLTAVILCHKDEEELHEHYKGNATEAQGKLYQTITPQTVEALRKGAELLESAPTC